MAHAIHSTGETMYFINCPVRNGWLTYMHDEKIYLMSFTSGEKAEEYNSKVLSGTGDVVQEYKRNGLFLAKRMIDAGVHWMIVDYPPINDTAEIWSPVPRELGRDYGIVDLKGVWKNR
tara:strand:+ start:3408 stop:3761 length:354 start_codon:yes stop_codon:yes gene_type:complete